MGFDLTKDAARSIPRVLPRQLMFQTHPKLLAEIPCNLTLFVMLNFIPSCKLHKTCWNWDSLKFSHTGILMIVGKPENKNVYPYLARSACLMRHGSNHQRTRFLLKKLLVKAHRRENTLKEGYLRITLLHSSFRYHRRSDFCKGLFQTEGNTLTAIRTGSLVSRGEDPTISTCESLISDVFSVRTS